MLEGVTSERPNRIQELVYELKVGAVMTSSLISVEPQTMMSSLRTILRDNRISGTPVATEGRLEGIVSMEDFIKWLAQGGGDCPVSEKMSGHVECIFDDEPLVHAVSKLDRFGLRPATNLPNEPLPKARLELWINRLRAQGVRVLNESNSNSR